MRLDRFRDLEISWPSQKIKFLVFQYVGGGEAQNFSNSQSLYRGGNTSTIMSLRVECSQLVFGKATALPRPAAVSLQGEFEAYNMEETKG